MQFSTRTLFALTFVAAIVSLVLRFLGSLPHENVRYCFIALAAGSVFGFVAGLIYSTEIRSLLLSIVLLSMFIGIGLFFLPVLFIYITSATAGVFVIGFASELLNLTFRIFGIHMRSDVDKLSG